MYEFVELKNAQNNSVHFKIFLNLVHGHVPSATQKGASVVFVGEWSDQKT